jgi:hypothetical protein
MLCFQCPLTLNAVDGFKSQPLKSAVLFEFFVVLLSPSRQMLRYFVKLDDDRFLAHHFHFVVC